MYALPDIASVAAVVHGMFKAAFLVAALNRLPCICTQPRRSARLRHRKAREEARLRNQIPAPVQTIYFTTAVASLRGSVSSTVRPMPAIEQWVPRGIYGAGVAVGAMGMAWRGRGRS